MDSIFHQTALSASDTPFAPEEHPLVSQSDDSEEKSDGSAVREIAERFSSSDFLSSQAPVCSDSELEEDETDSNKADSDQRIRFRPGMSRGKTRCKR